MTGRRKVTKGELKEALETSRSIRQALMKVGLKPAGGNYATANQLIKEFDIDTSHMFGKGWNRGDVLGLRKLNTKPLEDILVKDSTYSSSHGLRKRLIQAGFKEAVCEMCHRSTWNGAPISLELNHINGDRLDHRLENLQLLCPNCHAQTPTYRGKNIGNHRVVSRSGDAGTWQTGQA